MVRVEGLRLLSSLPGSLSLSLSLAAPQLRPELKTRQPFSIPSLTAEKPPSNPEFSGFKVDRVRILIAQFRVLIRVPLSKP